MLGQKGDGKLRRRIIEACEQVRIFISAFEVRMPLRSSRVIARGAVMYKACPSTPVKTCRPKAMSKRVVNTPVMVNPVCARAKKKPRPPITI